MKYVNAEELKKELSKAPVWTTLAIKEIIDKLAKDEPQTDCGDFADRLAYERGVKHAWEVAQKVFNSTVTFYEAEDVAKQIDKDINVRSKDKQQKDCNRCKFVGAYDTEFPCANCSRKTKDYYAKDEPQTDCAWR